MKDKFMDSELKERDYQQAIQPLMQLIREQGNALVEYQEIEKVRHEETNNLIADVRRDIQPMLDTFNNLRWGERILVKVGIFLGGIVTFAIGILELIKIATSLKK